ncbi:MAG TPA: dicarboxylate/amino acid:cation symporter [Steroidobacteraceae bacterium]|jgi:Na+/H+-dicarboxylate symporter|nr:dicarboxylate/amino acid:cation symporter [Steroidobacteraceae bacterium]
MKSRLTWFVILAMISGPLFGLFLHEVLGTGPSADSAAAGFSLVTSSFLRLIKMIIAPLVFSTLVVGVARMEGAAAIARIGAKALAWFVVATLVSMSIGLLAVQLFKPGLGLSASAAVGGTPAATPMLFKDFLEHIIPSSVVQAMANNEILQIVVFSVFFGAAASSLGGRVKRLIDIIDEIATVILRVTRYVMALAPLAIFAALASTVLTQGLNVLAVYAKYIGSFYLALVILWVFFALVLYFSLGRRALPLLSQIRSPLLLAFSTTSSEAAYPLTLERLESFGVSTRIASFVLPLGYSFNLCGSAMYCAFGVLFIAQIYRIDLSVHQQIVMLLILMVTSKGIAGVPRAGLMVIAASLSYFGLPEQGLVFVIAVDHVLDMGRTATNVLGNAVAATLVAKWEGELKEAEQEGDLKESPA